MKKPQKQLMKTKTKKLKLSAIVSKTPSLKGKKSTELVKRTGTSHTVSHQSAKQYRRSRKK